MQSKPLRVLVCADVSAAALARIRQAAPSVQVHQTTEPRQMRALLRGADVVFGLPPPELLADAGRLQWLQVVFAGVDRYVTSELRDAPFILTNARGVYGVAGAEHVLGFMLMFARGLFAFHRFQQEARWDRRIELAGTLAGKTLGIVGLGDIGSHLARRAKALDMEVLAVKRVPAEPPPDVDVLWTADRLPELLARAHHVALTVPLTPETRGLMDAGTLDLMQPGAYLHNIGRGALVDEDALLERLQSGRLAGAGLDVFCEEPLPAAHPFWRLPNVIITPHVGADTPWDVERAAALFADNLARFVAGEPLVNVVDKARGY